MTNKEIDSIVDFKVTIGDVLLSMPYVDNEKDIAFRYLAGKHGHFILNYKDNEIIDKDSKIKLKVKETLSVEEVKSMVAIKKKIIKDLTRYSNNLAKNNEKIVVIWNKETETFLVATNDVLDKGFLSAKYNQGLLYFINKKREGAKLENYKNISDLQCDFNEKFKLKDFSKYTKHDFQNNKTNNSYFEIPFEGFITDFCLKEVN